VLVCVLANIFPFHLRITAPSTVIKVSNTRCNAERLLHIDPVIRLRVLYSARERVADVTACLASQVSSSNFCIILEIINGFIDLCPGC
jgi:hypothetical protein